MSDKQELSSAKIEQGWRDTFSTENPFCPCNLKSFTKAVRWAERAMLQAAPAEPQPTCAWREEDPWGPMPDTYATSCGELWSFTDGGPAENRVKFCHRCGKPVEVVPYQQPADEDDADGVKPAWLTEPPTGQAFPTVDKLFDALGVPVAHNNHPLRHHDRTCPACNPSGVAPSDQTKENKHV